MNMNDLSCLFDLSGDQKNNPWTEFRKKLLSSILEKRSTETEHHGEN